MTLDNPAKLFLLTKAQVRRETVSALSELTSSGMRMDRDLVRYLVRTHLEAFDAINDAEELDAYLSDSRGISLGDWLDSLTWDHCK